MSKIWTEEENENRAMDTMKNPTGKRCGNCHWGGEEKGDNWTTCGHHIENFHVTSICTYWTSPNDKHLKAYHEKIKKILNI